MPMISCLSSRIVTSGLFTLVHFSPGWIGGGAQIKVVTLQLAEQYMHLADYQSEPAMNHRMLPLQPWCVRLGPSWQNCPCSQLVTSCRATVWHRFFFTWLRTACHKQE